MTDYDEKKIKEIKEELEEIVARWNGEDPGPDEDRAREAQDILDEIERLEKLIEAFNF